ncbi:MAG TPA: hypothetical protein VMU92_12550 [Acidobacteriaceae bacterium]|nr:hypothetical protein [Acidobacteriaceae bacterium]
MVEEAACSLFGVVADRSLRNGCNDSVVRSIPAGEIRRIRPG